MTFTLATYGTDNDYSWTTEGWIPSQVPADTDPRNLAEEIAERATEYIDKAAIDEDEYEWEVAAIARHIQAWLDENRFMLMQEAAPTINDIVTQLDDAASIEWVNLTPHAVNIELPNGGSLTVQPSGQLARVEQTRETLPDVGGVPVTRSTFGAVTGLPEPSIGKRFIVSALVLAQCAGREDVFAPGEAVRDVDGRVIGCKGLSAAPAVMFNK